MLEDIKKRVCERELVSPDIIESQNSLPDPFKFLNGSVINGIEDWEIRKKEIRDMYQYYMYGIWRDGCEERLSYKLAGDQMAITVNRNGKAASFSVKVALPNEHEAHMHEKGCPVVVVLQSINAEAYALSRGYAVITINTYDIASDNAAHTGAFYDLYPYGRAWEEQTGVLMAWAWGASKVLDALKKGAGEELNINPEKSIITGVSRWGKAALVGGAYDKRFKMAAPCCSGAGGMAIYRYLSQGKTYDFSSIDAPSSYIYGKNEPLESLQSLDEKGWFNDRFLEFSSVEKLPVDQHMLAGLIAEKHRYLFVIGSYISEDWINAPAMWLGYKAAKVIFNCVGLESNIACNMHKEGHALLDEDMVYMLDYFDCHVYGKECSSDLKCVTTSVFEEETNYDPYFDSFQNNWVKWSS